MILKPFQFLFEMEATKSEDAVASTSVVTVNEGFYKTENHPLYIDTVLRCLFAYGDYESLKRFRLVCSKWKENIDSLFIERSLFSFDSSRTSFPRSFIENPQSIQLLFSSIGNEVRFTGFKFEENLLTPPILKIYFEANKATMTHLEILNIHSLNERNRFNFEEMEIDDLIGPNLRKLKCSALENVNLRKKILVVSLDKLDKMSDLHLENCIFLVESDSEAKISPTKLHLVNFKGRQSGQADTFLFLLRDIIDFSNLTSLYLDCSEQKNQILFLPEGTGPILHFKDCSKIKRMTLISLTINLDGIIFPEELSLIENSYRLDEVKIRDFSVALFLGSKQLTKMAISSGSITLDFGFPISVKELTIHDLRLLINFPISEQTEMKVTKLNIYTNYYYEVDLSVLPKSLQYLFLENTSGSIKCSSPFVLPKLKYLTLSKDASLFSYFQSCLSLDNLQIDGFMCNKNVLKSTFCYPLCKTNLDTFVLKDCVFWQMHSVVESQIFYPKTKTFVFHYMDSFNKKQIYLGKEYVDFLIAAKTKMKCDRLAFGPVEWGNENEFLKSSLAKFATVRAEYYLIEGHSAKPLEYDEFLALYSFP